MIKDFSNKVAGILKLIFGYGILLVVSAGAMTFLCYVIALVIGGDTAAMICQLVYKKIIPVIVKITSTLIVIGMAAMYFSGELALTVGNKK